MSWKFPRRIPKPGQVLDAQDLDDAFLPYVDEEGGHLGEHNFSNSLQDDLLRGSDLAPDICMSLKSIAVEADASAGPAAFSSSGVTGGGSAGANVQRIEATGSWISIDGLSHTFTTAGGMLYALASMQLGVTVPYAVAGVLNGPDANIMTMRLGIRLDGQVYPILTIGDQDSYDEGDWMELGLGGWCIGADVEGCVPLTPGSHTLDFVVSAHTIDRADFTNIQEVRGEILNRELIALGIW